MWTLVMAKLAAELAALPIFCWLAGSGLANKKLSYRREAVRCLVLLSIFVSR